MVRRQGLAAGSPPELPARGSSWDLPGSAAEFRNWRTRVFDFEPQNQPRPLQNIPPKFFPFAELRGRPGSAHRHVPSKPGRCAIGKRDSESRPHNP